MRTPTQVETLEGVAAFCGRGSLIPEGRKYHQQRSRYEYQTRKAGLSALHGLRHAYAQQRFFDLTGQPCPALGGKSRREMTPEEIQGKLDDAYAELFSLRFQFSVGQVQNSARLGQMRRDIARLNTILRAKELRSMQEQGAE